MASYLSHVYVHYSGVDTLVIVSVCLTVGTSIKLTTCACIAMYSTHHTKYTNEEGTNLSAENNFPLFQTNAVVVIRVKVKKCEQTLQFICHVLLRMRHWRSKISKD